LCFGASAVLIIHNYIYSPKSLITSGIVLFSVVIFSLFYYEFRKRRGRELSDFMDNRLREDENN